MSKKFEFLKQCQRFFVLTVKDDSPIGRPFGAVAEFGSDLYIATSNKKEVYGQIKQNPNVQLVAIKDGCRDWIRISGKAEECQDIKTKTKMFEACPVLEKHYGTPQCEFLAVFKIKVDEAELSDKDGVNKID